MLLLQDNFIETLEQRLSNTLPGVAKQYEMASLRRISELNLAEQPDYSGAKQAAVMNLLHYADGAWRTILIRRAEHPEDRHSGQVSFPGGKFELSDESLAATALREVEEEIGVPATRIRLLGQMTSLYIPVSNFLVHPFVGVLDGSPDFRFQEGEVVGVLQPALADFKHPERRKVTDLQIAPNLLLREVPYFDVEGYVVWGATAMMLNEFLAIL